MGFAPFRPLRHLFFVATSVLVAGFSATADADDKVTRALNQMMPQVSAENKAWTGMPPSTFPQAVQSLHPRCSPTLLTTLPAYT